LIALIDPLINPDSAVSAALAAQDGGAPEGHGGQAADINAPASQSLLACRHDSLQHATQKFLRTLMPK
jgi:hypothetical protein